MWQLAWWTAHLIWAWRVSAKYSLMGFHATNCVLLVNAPLVPFDWTHYAHTGPSQDEGFALGAAQSSSIFLRALRLALPKW